MKKLILLILLTTIISTLKATIVVPPANLAEMAYNADLVIYATAESHQNGNSYINNFRVLEAIKGDVSTSDIVVVEEYSGESDGRRRVISGDVDFQLGYNYVLFLSQVGTGNYKARQLSMGVFEEGNMAGQAVLGRNGTMLDLVLSGNTAYDYNELTGLYLTTEFVNHMRAVMDNTANWNYINAGFVTYNNTATGSNGMPLPPSLEKAGPCPNDAPCHCATLFGPPGAAQTKYEDNTWTVCVAGGAQTDPQNANNIGDLQTAITTMNGMPGINISYTGVDAACNPGCGSGSAADDALACAGGFGVNCNKMFVFFDDPCGEITDVDAQCSGTLGIGGHFSGAPPHVDACGDSWQTACGPFFVMNNFGVCAPNTVNQDAYIAVLIHEMLHAVGVGHHYDATAFTTTAAGDNACGTGEITHDSAECTGLMNPVVCNTTPPSAGNGYSISALDNACTDWMYNITSASNCTITNVMVTNAVCDGNDLTFDVTFDYTDADEDADGNTTFSVEFDGLPVLINQPVTGDANTDVGQTYNVTVTGPTAGGMSTITIRNDAVFSCTGDALNVDFPQCPPPCADNCADLMSMVATDCGSNYYPDVATYPNDPFLTSVLFGDGTGTGCQTYDPLPIILGAGTGNSHTICTEYTAGSNAAAFIVGPVFGNTTCIDLSTIVYEASSCTDASTLPGVTVLSADPLQLDGLTGNTDYIVCHTFTENACPDDNASAIFEVCNDIVEIGLPACMSMPDVILPTDVCNGANVLIDFGPNCVPNPDLGADSGYGIFLYLDANGVPTTFPPGSNFTFDDLINGVDPNLTFVAVNAGGCTDLDFVLGLVNATCDPVDVSIGVMPIDVAQNATFGDCPVEEFILTVHPNYEVVEDLADGCNPIAGAFVSDGAGGFFDVDGDAAITFADACFTAQLDPTADCTDAATLNYDFTTDIDAANPTCYADLTGTLTCTCTDCVAVADPAQTGVDCANAIDICNANCPLMISNVGNSPASDFCAVPACTGADGDHATWLTVVGDGGTYTFNTNGSDFDTQIAVFTDDGIGCLTCVGGDDDGGNGTQSAVTIATVAGETYFIVIDGFGTNEGNIIFNITDGSGANGAGIPLSIACPSAPAACPEVLTCPIITDVDTPANGCSSATEQTICVTYDQDPTGLVTESITVDGNVIAGVIDAANTQICYDIPMENTTCDEVTFDVIHAATCDADNDAPILDSDGADTNGSIGTITIFPVYQTTNPADDTADCGTFTVNLMSSNTDGSPATMCQTASLTCMANGDMFTIDYTAAPDPITNPITTQITDADILACSGVLSLSSAMCNNCVTPPTCPIITAVDAPANGCSSATEQTICVTYDQDPTGLVTESITVDGNVIAGVIDAANTQICYDIPMENTTCDEVTFEVIHAATCDADNDAPILDSDGADTNGSIGTITIFPVYQTTNPADDTADCGTFTVNLMSSNTDGSPATMCQTASLTCMANGDMFTIDYTAAPDPTTNPITTQITDADVLACSGVLSLSSAMCAGCTTPTTTIDITDPCSCDVGIDMGAPCGYAYDGSEPLNIDMDGDMLITDNGMDLVADLIEITVNPPVAGQTYMVGVGAADAGAALDCTGAPIAPGTPMIEAPAGSGIYQLVIYYPADGTGFGTMNFTSNTGLPQSITSAAPDYPPCDCEVTCGITVMIDNVCDDKETDDEGDDEITFFVTVLSNGDPLATTWTDGTLVGQAYDVAVMYGPLPADDAPFELTITDETNAICTLMVNEVADCSTLENIPTVGEWGLIILGLLMSIVAVVGIRQRTMTVIYQEIEE